MAEMHADVMQVLAASHLRTLPDPLIAELVAGGQRRTVVAGTVLHQEGEVHPHIELVLSGLVRVFVTAADGRTLTIRYARPGALLGVLSLFAVDFRMPATTQAIVASGLLVLRPDAVIALAHRDARVAGALLREQSERVISFISEIAGTAFSTVRERVARHLLDLAAEQQRDGPLVARLSQQDLASAVGTVREVVVRILRELRAHGVVQTVRGGIAITDPHRLLEEAGWNQGS